MTGRQTKKDLRQKYPNELKRKIAKAYESGESSYGKLAEEYGLKDKMVVKEFVKWYRRQSEILVENLGNDALNMKQKDLYSRGEGLDSELELLRRKLSYAELKVEALETMIDLAEQEFSIAIRKKSGTQQSKK